MIIESKYKRVPAQQPGLCFGCVFWEEHLLEICRKHNIICFVDGIHTYNFIEVPMPLLPKNIKIL